MKRKALFVGVNTYEDEQIRDLDFSLSDAHALKTMFELFGFESDILENPNKSDVFHAVRQMTADLGTGDLFLFYFAGHGWTTTSGKHLLFCSDDMYEDLRDDDAGISFDKLKRKTNGDFNRAFVLDACRSDFITGTRGGDTTTRDLRPIGELVKDASLKSSLAVLRSCSQYEHALEIRSRKHGLFTLAMMEVLRTSKECGSELLFGESLCDAVTDKMLYIAKAEGITAEQTPEFAKIGLAQVLIEGCKSSVPPVVEPSVDVQNFVVCPICGRHNDVKDTFKCPVCGKDHFCLSHQSKDAYCCPSCADKIAEEKLESRLKEADRLYEDGQFGMAIELYERCATAGNANAQNRLGYMCDKGQGVARNCGDAVKWYRLAAENGHVKAQCNLGECYANGDGVAKDFAEAVKWFRKAAEQGYAGAQYDLGLCYVEGQGVEQNDNTATNWFRKAAEQGYAEAQYNLGWCYINGRGVEQDDNAAVEWFHKAAEQGLAKAQHNLGWCYDEGRGVERDNVKAVKWYHMAAEQGDAQAQFALALIYITRWTDDECVSVDDIELSGDALKEEALRLIHEAASKGFVTAQKELGAWYCDGDYLDVDAEKGVGWYRKAAEQGDESAQYRLGEFYEFGLGVERDAAEAVKWYRKAAELGHVRAQLTIGKKFEVGFGVAKSFKEAFFWWQKAAEQGDVTAEANLGMCYEDGIGVAQSDTDAEKWYRKAAKQGERRAKDRLLAMDALGRIKLSNKERLEWSSDVVEAFEVV